MSSRSVILHIPSWFPDEKDPFAGDFIIRHLQAIQGITPIVSIHFTKSTEISEIQLLPMIDAEIPFIEVIIPIKTSFPFLNQWETQRAQRKAVKICCAFLAVHKINVLAIHSHVLHPAASIAVAFKRRLKCPWIHSEHWSALTKENGEYSRKSSLFRHYYQSILKEVDAFTFVSNYLGQSFVEHFNIKVPQFIVSNTVDTSLFNLSEATKKGRPFRFIHVSSLGEVKQAEAIIEAFLAVNHTNSELWLVGGSEEKNELLRRKFADERLQFLPPQSYDAVASLMQASDALVLNSLYETQSCVAIEALCCGLPVIAPHVAALPEFLNTDNAILFREGEIEKAFIDAPFKIENLDKERIAHKAKSLYSYTKIGAAFREVYHQLGIL
jgi:glycosyltransferase involved in cell wall biosynthesis